MAHLELEKEVIYICGYSQSAHSRSLSADSLDKLTSDNNVQRSSLFACVCVCVQRSGIFFFALVVVIGSQVLES